MIFCNRKLEKRIEELESELAGCKKIIDGINTQLADAEPVIDWKTMNVFSVERMASNNKPATIIGYILEEPIFHEEKEMWVPKQVVHEWTLFCNDARHKELVQQFKKYLESKK